MTELITVPTFTFNQGDIFNQEIPSERPIQVLYYDGTIALRQESSEFESDNEILIEPTFLDALFKAIKKHQKEANQKLNP